MAYIVQGSTWCTVQIKDEGDISQLLGMHFTRDRSARTISLD
jgi:hypothetical protein